MRVLYNSILWLAAFGMLATIIAGCQYGARAETPSKISAGVIERESLLALDFTDELADTTCYTFEDISDGTYNGTDSAILAVIADSVGDQIPDRELTEKELRRLGIWIYHNDERTIYVHKVIMYLMSYYQESGELPETGADFYADLLTPSGFNEFAAMSPGNRLAECLPMINTITGKFYDTFKATEWSPGGINIEIIDDPAVVMQKYGNYKVPTDPMHMGDSYVHATVVWEITMYGEMPGTILWQWEWIQ